MTDPFTFDPRAPESKSPYGAVPAGTRVRFTVRPLRARGFSRVVLSARFEGWEDAVEERVLPWTGLEGERDLFSGTLDTGDYVGLVWYTLRMDGLDGRRAELGEYQLTVYDGSEAVPAWFGEGLTYQIFPDRFRRRSVPDPAGMVGGRWVHPDWREEPVYLPDEHGGDPQPGLFRRQSGRSAGKTALSPGAGGGYPLLLPHLRGSGEPPLRHRRL